ncbi:hypothetical protein HYV86_07325 [Candidatus Woesearchaeota archaeon]|nr:hypothetical protein [Candidatus Woesearchaeota archaeon]
MSFKVTPHNLTNVLEQYADWREPTTLWVPYGRQDLEVGIEAPSRQQVQAALIHYDLRDQLGNPNLGLDVRGNYFGTGLALVTGRTRFDPKDFQISYRAIPIAPGLTMFARNREFLYTTQPEEEGGLERVTWVAPRFSEPIKGFDGRPFRMECIGPGMYQGTHGLL